MPEIRAGPTNGRDFQHSTKTGNREQCDDTIFKINKLTQHNLEKKCKTYN